MNRIHSTNKPVFLLGTQRSGTTLLTRMLNANNHLFIQNEMAIGSIFDENNNSDVMTNIVNALKEKHHVCVKSLERENKMWGWKDPMLTAHLSSLETHFSESKYILLVRDPRAVISSYIDNGWGLATNVYTGALRWSEEVRKQLDFADRVKNNCIMVKFEELILEPENVLRRVCSHLAIPYQEEMLRYHHNPLEFFENKSNRNTQQPPDIKNIGHWRDKFSKRQVAMINKLCEPLMNELGYRDETDLKILPMWIEKNAYLIHQKVMGEIQLQFQLRKARFLNSRKKSLNKRRSKL